MTTKIAVKGKIQRTYYNMILYVSAYQSSKNGLEEVDEECCAQLISSSCKSGFHAPALDFDFPIGVRTDMVGVLVFRKYVPQIAYFKLLDILVDLKISNEDFREMKQRIHIHPHYGECDCLILSPELQFCTKFKLVGSTTLGHHHLYIEKELSWKDYQKLLTAFYKANLIEKDFYQVSIKDKMSLLFKPGIQKDKINAKEVNIDL